MKVNPTGELPRSRGLLSAEATSLQQPTHLSFNVRRNHIDIDRTLARTPVLKLVQDLTVHIIDAAPADYSADSPLTQTATVTANQRARLPLARAMSLMRVRDIATLKAEGPNLVQRRGDWPR